MSGRSASVAVLSLGAIAVCVASSGPARATRAERASSLPLAFAGPTMVDFDPTGPAVAMGPINSPQGVALGDFNADGRQDLVVSVVYRSGRGGVAVLLNRGRGFGARRDYRSKAAVGAVAVADLNGDGEPDIVVTKPGANVVTALINLGSRRFARRSYGTGKHPAELALADLSRDGHPDLVVSNEGSNSVSVLLNSGSGKLGARHDYRTGHAVASFGLGDVDGDGDSDLSVVGATRSVSVLLNGGDGSFAVRRDTGIRAGDWGESTAGDLNADGKADLVVSDNSGLSEGPNNAEVAVLLARGDGRYAAPHGYHAGDFPREVALADLDHDGSLDLAVIDDAPDDSGMIRVSLLANGGNGTLGRRRDYGLVDPSTTQPMTVGDFNGDGWADLATASSEGTTVALYVNSTGRCGVLSPELEYELGFYGINWMRRALVRNGCRVGPNRRAYSALGRGTVVNTRPAPGSVLPLRTKVSIVLSRGKRPRSRQ